jgi:phosphoenolpyruvate carboxykinase (ATP)
MGTHPFAVYLVNTGRVGGPEGHADSKKLQIEHSGAIVKAIAEETISWERDPDFGYEVASVVPGIDDVELLQPRRLYERTGRTDEYARLVATLKRERVEFLASYPGLRAELLAAVS